MNRTELVASLTEQVSNNVEKIAISDSLEILTKDLEEKEEK